MPLKVFDYQCVKCSKVHLDQIVDPKEAIPCPICGKAMSRLFPAPRALDRQGRFSPFWSETFQMRVNDREDLSKMKDLRKVHNLECVGHTRVKPDRAAIKHRYEND